MKSKFPSNIQHHQTQEGLRAKKRTAFESTQIQLTALLREKREAHFFFNIKHTKPESFDPLDNIC